MRHKQQQQQQQQQKQQQRPTSCHSSVLVDDWVFPQEASTSMASVLSACMLHIASHAVQALLSE